eukprot:3815430-Rhodomonas_salina.1
MNARPVVLKHYGGFLLLQSELAQDVSKVAHVTAGCRCRIELRFRGAEGDNRLSVRRPRDGSPAEH